MTIVAIGVINLYQHQVFHMAVSLANSSSMNFVALLICPRDWNILFILHTPFTCGILSPCLFAMPVISLHSPSVARSTVVMSAILFFIVTVGPGDIGNVYVNCFLRMQAFGFPPEPGSLAKTFETTEKLVLGASREPILSVKSGRADEEHSRTKISVGS
ncbi:hypothetical protein REPUB_Repub06bG0048300 [Reevesia pubescens]